MARKLSSRKITSKEKDTSSVFSIISSVFVETECETCLDSARYYLTEEDHDKKTERKTNRKRKRKELFIYLLFYLIFNYYFI